MHNAHGGTKKRCGFPGSKAGKDSGQLESCVHAKWLQSHATLRQYRL